MNYSTLLLDADNTIFDFDRCEYLAFRETILFFGFSFDNTVFAAFHDINDSLWKELEKGFITVEALRVRRFSLLLRACFPDADANELGTRMAEVYVQMLSGQTVLLEHSLEDIQLLSAQYTLCVITNGISSVQRNRFAHSPVMPYIQKLYISGEIGAQKPKKAFFEAVLQDLQEKDLHRLAVVGDSLTSDMQGGRNAGLTTILFDPAGKVPMPHPLCDYRIRRLKDILLLERGEGYGVSSTG